MISRTSARFRVRIATDYRALGVREGEVVIRFWTGSNADYDDLVARA